MDSKCVTGLLLGVRPRRSPLIIGSVSMIIMMRLYGHIEQQVAQIDVVTLLSHVQGSIRRKNETRTT